MPKIILIMSSYKLYIIAILGISKIGLSNLRSMMVLISSLNLDAMIEKTFL